MFSKQFSARLEEVRLRVVRLRGEEKRATIIKLVYDFTPQLAECIGGDAPAMQSLLAEDGDRAARMKGGRIVLDVNDVNATLNAGKEGGKIAFENTSRISASVKRPTADGGTMPVIVVSVTLHHDEENEENEAWEFLRSNIGQNIKARMDKRQTEFPLVEEEPNA